MRRLLSFTGEYGISELNELLAVLPLGSKLRLRVFRSLILLQNKARNNHKPCSIRLRIEGQQEVCDIIGLLGFPNEQTYLIDRFRALEESMISSDGRITSVVRNRQTIEEFLTGHH